MLLNLLMQEPFDSPSEFVNLIAQIAFNTRPSMTVNSAILVSTNIKASTKQLTTVEIWRMHSFSQQQCASHVARTAHPSQWFDEAPDSPPVVHYTVSQTMSFENTVIVSETSAV